VTQYSARQTLRQSIKNKLHWPAPPTNTHAEEQILKKKIYETVYQTEIEQLYRQFTNLSPTKMKEVRVD